MNFEMIINDWGDWEASLSQSKYGGLIKGLLFLDLNGSYLRGFSTLEPRLWRPRGFSISIWMKGNQGASWPRNRIVEMLIKRLLYFDLMKGKQGDPLPRNRSCGNQRASTSILMKGNQKAYLPWNRSCVDQGASLAQSWWKVTNGLLYLGTGLLKCRSNGFSTLTWIVEMSIKGLLYFDLNNKNVDQRASLLWSGLSLAKSQNSGLDFK